MKTTMITRDQAWELLNQYTNSDALLKHALAVEAVMRHFAQQNGEDEELWGVVGLLHDIDYEQYPDEHCVKAAEILRDHDVDETIIHAVCSHGYQICSDVEPENLMEKTLYTIDELTGLINAVCLMRPSKSVLDVELKSVKKKYKQSNFAAGVDRSIVERGVNMLNANLDEIITETIMGMRSNAEAIGLKGNL